MTRRSKLARVLTGGAVAAVVLACNSTTSPVEFRALGVLVPPRQDGAAQIFIPDTINAGEPFPVTVLTYGGGCYRKGEMEVSQRSTPYGEEISLTPYDYAAKERVCSRVLQVFAHTALAIAPAGHIIVSVRGRGRDSNGEPGAEITVTREGHAAIR
jgi:hypothetical protein